MADIVVGTQVVNSIVRLKMHGQHFVDITVFKGCFITVNIVRALFVNGFHIFVQCGGMQDVIVVKQTDVFSGGHGIAGVGIAGNSFIFRQFFIADAFFVPFLFHVGSTDFSHFLVRLIGTVRQTELPVFIGLRQHGVYHRRQKFLRCIVKRHQNADLHRSFKYGFPFFFRLFRRRKAVRTVAFHDTFFLLFLF